MRLGVFLVGGEFETPGVKAARVPDEIANTRKWVTGGGERVLVASASDLLDDEASEESGELSVLLSLSMVTLMGHPNRQSEFEEAPTLTSVTQALVQLFRTARPIEGAIDMTT